MKRRLIVSICLAALGVSALFFWLRNEWPLATYDLSVVYTGRLMGELEPCGCAEETDVGGMSRQATMIERLRKDAPDIMLISAGGLISNNTWQDQVKAKYILKALDLMHYDSIGVQWRDLAYGTGFIRMHNPSWVNSNSLLAEIPFARQIRRKNGAVAHFSWLDPTQAQDEKAPDKSQAIIRDAERLNGELAEAKRTGAITLVSTTVPPEGLSQRIKLDLVDVLMTSAADEKYLEPRQVGNTLVLHYGTRGMRIAKLDLAIDGRGKITGYRNKVFTLAKSVPDSANLAEWYSDYNKEIKERYDSLAQQRKVLESGNNSFAGAQSCAACHRTSHAIWAQTKHAKAFSTLERVNKQFDPDCIGCHTVGFNKSGGFIDSSVSGFLTDVQCESCHGAGRQHMNSGGMQKTLNADWPSESICRQCHVGDHSPKFSFASYWNRIAHAKEGHVQ